MNNPDLMVIALSLLSFFFGIITGLALAGWILKLVEARLK